MDISASLALDFYMKETYKNEIFALEVNIRTAACDGKREITYSLLNEKNSFSKYLAKKLPNFNVAMRNDVLERMGLYPELLSYLESYGYSIQLHRFNDEVPSCTISW